MKKKSMAKSTMGYMIVALFLFLILTFIYFGHTGFFRKIYKITDKIGITRLAKDIQELEENITGEGYELSPEEKAVEEKIKSVMGTMMSGIDSCLKGQNCVCSVSMPQFPEEYVIRFINGPENKVYVSAFRFKSRTGFDFDEDFQGQTGIHFVSGATHKFENTKVCLVVDLAEEWSGTDVAEIEIRNPHIGMLQLYWEDKAATFQSGTQLWATEAKSPGVIYNSERDYRIYGVGGAPNRIYKTNDGRFCFFAERWGWDDDKLIENIKCGESEEKD